MGWEEQIHQNTVYTKDMKFVQLIWSKQKRCYLTSSYIISPLSFLHLTMLVPENKGACTITQISPTEKQTDKCSLHRDLNLFMPLSKHSRSCTLQKNMRHVEVMYLNYWFFSCYIYSNILYGSKETLWDSVTLEKF